MRIVGSLVMVIGLAALLRSQWIGASGSTVFAVGMLVLCAWLFGLLCEKVRLPALTGYLIVGAVMGPYVFGLIEQEQIQSMRFASDLAVALIGLIAGGEIEFRHIRGQVGRLGGLIASHIVILLLVVGGGIFLARPITPIFEQADSATFGIALLLLATVTVAASPAVVVAMITSYRAAGPLSRMTMLMAVLKDLVLVILFAVALSIGRAVLGDASTFHAGVLLAIAVQLVGSILLGVVFGLFMAGYAHRIASHLVVFTIGSCMFIALLGEIHFTVMSSKVHLEPLLMALSAGMLMRNVWGEQTESLFSSIESTSTPVYCLFFGLAGAKFAPQDLVRFWPMALGLSALRLFGLWFSMKVGLRLTGYREPALRGAWIGLWPQAGVSLVLVMLIQNSFTEQTHAVIQQAAAVLLTAIFIDQFLGPIGFRLALGRSGEIGRLGRQLEKTNGESTA